MSEKDRGKREDHRVKAVEEKERSEREIWVRWVTDAPSCSRAGVRILCVPLSAFAAKANCWVTKIKEIFLVNGESVEINDPTGAACNYCGPESNNLSQ